MINYKIQQISATILNPFLSTIAEIRVPIAKENGITLMIKIMRPIDSEVSIIASPKQNKPFPLSPDIGFFIFDLNRMFFLKLYYI